jgi:hypothetical protein
MELKRLITQFIYRIEPKPEGGFIARPSDPTLPPLEAATREELQEKIHANIAAGLAAEFPSLKLPLENQGLKFAFHIEHKPEGGFTVHAADPNAPSIEGATHQEIESHFAERLIGFLGKHFMPELSQALAAQDNSGDIKVFVNRKVGFTLNAGSRSLSHSSARGAGSNPAGDVKIEDTKPCLGSPGQTISNSPIVPEASSSWNIFRFLLAVTIVSALMYVFFFYHR